MPFFSIIIPTYNRAEMLSKAIESVLRQTYEDWELIIVDDGSIDSTREVISKYYDNRIRYIYQKNQERSAARNNGIHNAQGRYICFLDSDDLYLEHHLETFHNEIYQHEEPIAFFLTGFKKDKFNGNYTEYFWRTPAVPAQVCIHSTILKTYCFILGIEVFEDMALWMEISIVHTIIGIKDVTIIYNKNENNSTNIINNSYSKMYNAAKIFFIQKPHIKKYISKSIYNQVMSEIHFGIAKYGIITHNKPLIYKHILASMYLACFHKHTLHRIYVLFFVLRNKIENAIKIIEL